ncbi:NAD(P)-binding protein [Phenylobacterium aquaticum]|uniref:NAD(P)-binding protein n=1 Tax=Phenylobacterium aquaticum TaxID=1763816 RepID=UPI001F5C49DB|nr:NAD(P)-binding protein [Phenylobacterium aquaticum]MCI3133323.1 NAD(P)-binding protein [Phenylobacterium aquaticum]
MQVNIAGAGIGGLAAALALDAAGHEVTVYEAAPKILPLGVGINLLPHAAEVLDELGLIDALLARGVATRELVYFNRHGQRIWGEPAAVSPAIPRRRSLCRAGRCKACCSTPPSRAWGPTG